MSSKIYDVIIVGGGVMGCSTAYSLTRTESHLKLGVVERDTTYTEASTTLSMANIRVQFDLEENVRVSLYAQEVFRRFEEEMTVDDDRPSIGYRREGNLFFVDKNRREAAERALAIQKKIGCAVEWWSPDKIQETYPLYTVEGLVGGTFGAEDGYVDPYAVLMAYRAKAKSQGAEFLKDEVVEILNDGDRISGVRLASGERLSAGAVVNCAGPWASELARTAGVELPIIPVKQEMYAVDPAVKPGGALPFTFHPSGLCWRSETGGLILVGEAFDEARVGFDFSWDRDRFMDVIWPKLAELVPAFDTLKLVRGWAGLYAVNTLDHNAVLGEWPSLKGFFLANGFSGHGFQQGPAVGRYISELILGVSPTLDLSCFHPDRILENRPLEEQLCY